MTAEEQDERAAAAIFAVKRHAAQLRTDPAAANAWLHKLNEYELRTMLGAALALVPSGPVDPWWQRRGAAHDAVIAHRQAVLLGREAA